MYGVQFSLEQLREPNRFVHYTWIDQRATERNNDFANWLCDVRHGDLPE